MTIKDITNQIISLSETLGIETNDRTEWSVFSKTRLENHLRKHEPKLGKDYIMHIDLPDGKWLLFIYRYAETPDGFDYSIPENRADEYAMLSMSRAF